MRALDSSCGDAATDWSTMTVAQMWAMVADHSQEVGYTQAAAWDRTRELVDHHMSRLAAYRDDLLRAWNPQTSPAAAAYVAKLDELIDSMVAVCDAAAANGAALSHINASLAEARVALEPVYRQWATIQAKVDAHEQKDGQALSGRGTPTFTTAQRQLHDQAVTIMSTLGSRTNEATNAMRQPPPYQAPVLRAPDGKAIVPLPDPGGPSHLATTPPAPSVPPITPGREPMLSGARFVSPAPTLQVGIERPGDPAAVGNPTVPVPAPVVRPAGNPGFRIIGPTNPETTTERIPGGTEPERIPTGGASVNGPGWLHPPGGVIGGSAPEVVDPAHVQAGPRVNPPGGVIGPTTGRETEGMFAPAVGGAHSPNQRRRQRNHAYDSDEYWPVHRGVPAVIEPGPEPVHDPGPFIGPRP